MGKFLSAFIGGILLYIVLCILALIISAFLGANAYDFFFVGDHHSGFFSTMFDIRCWLFSGALVGFAYGLKSS